jgi:integrase/recombinase XerD
VLYFSVSCGLHDWQSYFPRDGITAYLRNSGKLEVAQQIANHEAPRTTKLYDRRQDEISLDEIERIAI